MPIYDLDNINYLEHDLETLLDRLSDIYDIKFIKEKIEIIPKISDISKTFWASEENTIEFNKHVPNYKSLIRDMYAFVENITVFKLKKYDYSIFEAKYPNFKEFRLLNNKLKHQEKKSTEISFTKIVLIDQNLFDLCCNFKYPDKLEVVMYSKFVIIFLTIIKDFKLIETKLN